MKRSSHEKISPLAAAFSWIVLSCVASGLAFAQAPQVESIPAGRNPGYLGLAADENPNGRGAMVIEVTGGSPAARAGLKTGDVILAIDGRVVEGLSSMVDVLRARQSGDKVKMDVLRQNRLLRFEFALGARPRQPGVSPRDPSPPEEEIPRANYAHSLLGLQLDDVPASARTAGGVVVASVLVRTGDERPRIPAGAFIRELNRVPVRTAADCERILAKFRPGDQIQVTYVVENLVKRITVTLGAPATPREGDSPAQPDRPGLIESRLGEAGRRPILGRLGRALDGALGDAITEDGPRPGRPKSDLFPPGDIPPAGVPRDVRPPIDASNDELANEVRELRLLVEVLLERVEELEKNSPARKKIPPNF